MDAPDLAIAVDHVAVFVLPRSEIREASARRKISILINQNSKSPFRVLSEQQIIVSVPVVKEKNRCRMHGGARVAERRANALGSLNTINEQLTNADLRDFLKGGDGIDVGAANGAAARMMLGMLLVAMRMAVQMSDDREVSQEDCRMFFSEIDGALRGR